MQIKFQGAGQELPKEICTDICTHTLAAVLVNRYSPNSLFKIRLLHWQVARLVCLFLYLTLTWQVCLLPVLTSAIPQILLLPFVLVCHASQLPTSACDRTTPLPTVFARYARFLPSDPVSFSSCLPHLLQSSTRLLSTCFLPCLCSLSPAKYFTCLLSLFPGDSSEVSATHQHRLLD